MRGRARGGHIELDGALPEGAEVVVLTADAEEPFDLDDAQLTELEARMAEADRGEVDPAAAILEKLRRGRFAGRSLSSSSAGPPESVHVRPVLIRSRGVEGLDAACAAIVSGRRAVGAGAGARPAAAAIAIRFHEGARTGDGRGLARSTPRGFVSLELRARAL